MASKETLILVVSAITDAIITVGTALTAAMVAVGGEVMLPSKPVLLLAAIGGVVSAARTIQQGLKSQVAVASAAASGIAP